MGAASDEVAGGHVMQAAQAAAERDGAGLAIALATQEASQFGDHAGSLVDGKGLIRWQRLCLKVLIEEVEFVLGEGD